jgi:hypothetical protein
MLRSSLRLLQQGQAVLPSSAGAAVQLQQLRLLNVHEYQVRRGCGTRVRVLSTLHVDGTARVDG